MVFATQCFEVQKCAVILAAVADFVAVEQFERAGLVGERGEGEGRVHGRDFGILLIGKGVVEALLFVDSMDVLGHFETPEAAAAPVGDGHDFDETALGCGFGLELFLKSGEKLGEGRGSLAGEDDRGGGGPAALRCDRAAGFGAVSTGSCDTKD